MENKQVQVSEVLGTKCVLCQYPYYYRSICGWPHALATLHTYNTEVSFQFKFPTTDGKGRFGNRRGRRLALTDHSILEQRKVRRVRHAEGRVYSFRKHLLSTSVWGTLASTAALESDLGKLPPVSSRVELGEWFRSVNRI